MTIRSILAAVGAASLLSFSSPAIAEMGSSPVAPGGSYLSIFGGFFDTNIDKVNGYASGTPLSEKRADVDGDGFGGIEFGHSPANGLSWVDRVELYFEFGGGDDKTSESAVPFQFRSVNGVNLAPSTASTASVKRDYDYYDFGVRLRNDRQNLGGSILPVFFEPFLRFTNDDTKTRILSTMAITLNRDADVDSWFLGFMAGVDPEFQVSPRVKLVASLAAGLYYVDADGDFTSSSNTLTVYNQSVSDDDDAIGFRGRAQGAVKFAVTQAAIVSLFAGVDYWSDVPTADLPSATATAVQPAAKVDMDDALEVKAGARLTIALDALGIGN